MLTPKQVKIFEAFLRRPYQEFTYNDIKEFGKGKSNSVVQGSIVKYMSENLITKRDVGNMVLYSLNLENDLVYSYFNILISERLSPLAKKTLQIIQNELRVVEFLTIVIFGSYASQTQTKESDLDVAVFVNSADDRKKCLLSLKTAELKSILRIDAHVFTADEMLQMLKEKKENLGKQIASKHLAVLSPNIFYSILQKGIDNGLKIVYTEG